MLNNKDQAAATRETYLQEVSQRIRLKLSPLEAYESIQEMRDHLNSMADAYEEFGIDPAASMQAAIQKFGEASQVGQELAKTGPDVMKRLNAINIRVPISFLVHIATVSFIASAAMIAVDTIYVARHSIVNHDYPMDIAIGQLLGLIVGSLAWNLKVKPTHYVFGIVAATNLVLSLTLYQTYLLLGQGQNFCQLAIGLSTATGMFSYGALKVASFVRSISISVHRKPVC